MDIGGWSTAFTLLVALAASAGVFVVSFRNSSTRATVNQYRDTAASQAVRLAEYAAAQTATDVKIAALESDVAAKTAQLATLERVVTGRDLITEQTSLIVKNHLHLTSQLERILDNQKLLLGLAGDRREHP